MRYFIEIAYKGTNYHGWQSQENAVSVQEVIEECLCTILQEEIKITGSGRTDAGVHAAQQFAHFDTEKDLFEADYLYKINGYLPKDIAVKSIQSMVEDAHSRFAAERREYIYYLTQSKDPFGIESKWYFNTKLDIEKMNVAAAILLKKEDFTSFSKVHTDTPHNLCDITKAVWSVEGEELSFLIEANRFLRGMVRAIVGTLIEVGLDKITDKEFEEIIDKKDRSAAAANAPAHGLFLNKITYPKEIFN